MQELVHEHFHRVKPLIEGGHIHPEIVSIIEHNNPGWIFVDQIDSPKTALVWSKGIKGFYLIGDHTNERFLHNLDVYIKETVEPRMRKASLKHFEVSGHHDEWALESIFPTRKLYNFEQIVMRLLKRPQLMNLNEIETINLKADDWENQEFQNTDIIYRHLELFWSTKDDFKKKGFGYAAIEGKEITGVCYSSFVTQDTHAIGIETMPQFQTKGVGTYLASLLVEEIYQNGFTPYWDCSLDNEPSIRIAERLGFDQKYCYKCYGFEL